MQVKLQGFAELQQRLKEFGPKVEKSGLRAATRASAVVFRDAIRLTAPVKTGLLKANIVVNSRRGDGPNIIRYGARIKAAKKIKYGNTRQNRRLRRVGKKYQMEGPAFYGRFLEYGTSRMHARPFMRPAFGANINKALDAFKTRMAKAIVEAAKKQ
jgi:HK97 gp10 family phage protein